MIPSLRLLLLLLLGSTLVAGVALLPALLWLAVAYLLAVAALVAADALVTTRPQAIEVERINDSKLSLGAQNLVTLLIANRSARSLRFQLRDEHPLEIPADAVILSGAAAPFGLAELHYHLRPLRRGDFAFGDVNIRYPSALGTFTRQARYPAAAQVKVYPNVLDVRKYDLLARKGLLFELGLRPARIFGQGAEFERLREYNTDDEFRRINWKATARRGKPIAAEYETERSQYVVSAIDTGRLMRPPIGDLAKLDYAINASLMLSYVATLKGDHVGMLSFADDVRTYLAPRRGRGQFYRMLEALYNVQFEPVEADYARALTYLGLKHKRRSLVVLFTDLVTLDAARPLVAHLARLAQRHLPLCVVISDPNVTRLAAQPARSSEAVYQRAVAEMLLDERQVVLDTLHRSGVLTLDVPADKLTVALINKYLELKGRGVL
ncbi:MAG TPA: DUF58 domain-containing protein [Roseiflexaceae bacterium]|nr:DUF58 domain-containing protein [Roseiflexaceae bacterium]